MSDAQPPLPERAPGTVLIIDDHELVGTSLMLSLRSEGLSAHHSGGSGFDDVLTTAAGLVSGLALLDLDLGRDRDGKRMDGVRLVAPLRADSTTRTTAGAASGPIDWNCDGDTTTPARRTSTTTTPTRR
jgi:CheY-like chemotaxis protein